MDGRNPFTAISNLSFVRNAHPPSGARPPARSCSGANKNIEYKGSYLKDTYLLDCDSRRQQQILQSKVMGIESLRYRPQPIY